MHGTRQYYVARFPWVQVDGVWVLKQPMWEPYDRSEWEEFQETGRLPRRMRQTFAQGIAAGAGASIPQEIFLSIAERATGVKVPSPELIERSYQKLDIQEINAWRLNDWFELLAHLSLVCRAWRARCAPLLHSKVIVYDDSEDVTALMETLRPQDCLIRTYARDLRVKGEFSTIFVACAKLLPRLPNVSILHCDGPRNLESPCVLPQHVRGILSGSRSALRGVKVLNLRNCAFSATIDFLRLFSAFPALSWVNMLNIDSDYILTAPSAAPRVKTSLLTCVATNTNGFDWFPTLAHAWSWPHPKDDPVAGGFPGLSSTETRIAVQIMQCLRTRDLEHKKLMWDHCLHPNLCAYLLLTL